MSFTAGVDTSEHKHNIPYYSVASSLSANSLPVSWKLFAICCNDRMFKTVRDTAKNVVRNVMILKVKLKRRLNRSLEKVVYVLKAFKSDLIL